MARWEREYLDRTPGFSGVAANIGTTVHAALESYVEKCYINKTHAPGLDLLKDLYNISYIETFQSADFATPEYKDGLALTIKWHKRTDITNEVLSVEIKENFPVPFDHPEGSAHSPCEYCKGTNLPSGTCQRPLNYVMDRLDKTGEDEYEVVDYKTIRVPVNPEDLRSKPQVRMYALAVQIKYPNAKRIKVTFDLLRHERVSTVITRDDNIASWRWLTGELKRIVDTPSGPSPTLNMECGYCVMKSTCNTLRKNIEGGGIHSMSIAEVADLKLQLESQAKAQEYLLAELDDILLREAYNRESLEYDAGETLVEVKAQRRRQVHPPDVAKIIGPGLFSQLGRITMAALDDLLKGEELDPEQKIALKGIISVGMGEPHAKVKKRSTLL